MPATPQRIGFFGGSFDPPHNGHRAVALAAADRFALDHVFVAPTGRQALKTTNATASFADRLGMVAAMCEGLRKGARPGFLASELDAPHADGSPNFTVDALRALRNTEPDAQLFVIVGADAFAGLHRWREPDALLSLASWIVVSRTDVGVASSSSSKLSAGQEGRVHHLTGVDVPVSATEIRSRLAAGQECSKLLPSEVLAYIRRHALYGEVEA